MRPQIVKSRAESAAIIHKALRDLGVARRERLSEEDYDVYQEGLRQFQADVVAEVCKDFARKPQEDFGPRFPTLGSIRQGCSDVLKRREIRIDQATLKLPEGRPVDPPTIQQFKARVQALIDSKTMPKVNVEREPGSDDA